MSALVPAPGARLRVERERQGLSVQKAADEMRLDAWVIEALETDQYERVGPAVYVRGHLKKYASILAIPGEEIVAGYESLRAAMPAAPPKAPAARSMSSQPLVHNLTRGQIVAAGFLLLLITGVLLWKPWQQRAAAVAPSHASETAGAADGAPGDGEAQQAPPANAGDAAAAQDAGAMPQSADRTASAPGENAPLQGSNAPTAAATAATVGSGAATAAAAAGGPSSIAPTGAVPPPKGGSPATPAASGNDGAGRANLRLSFSADSWVDVWDASGRQIFSGNGRANSVKTIAGAAPLRVYLGYASGVQLEINQRAIAIARPFLHGDVARFQAGADGVLRPYSNSVRPRG
jgi:cytoskeleton protein RodZ